jgi:hypothetical protein
MASLDDLLTAQKNAVVAFNGGTSDSQNKAGTTNTREISAQTLVKTSAGWVATVSVITGGSAGYLYDTNAVSKLTGNKFYKIPTTEGVYQIQMPYNVGLVVAPGSGQVVAIGYS